MIKKLIHLEEEDIEKMEKVRKETGATISWQIREAIKQYLKTKKA
jgi:predicted DNA-binding protein